ncbi:MAG: VanZ family protein [Candidatus Aminicenantaceae bacterium]
MENRRNPFYWLPPLLWMAFLFPLTNKLLSSPVFYRINEWIWKQFFPGAGRSSSDLSYLVFRKGLHLAAYALLAFLVYRFFRSGAAGVWKKEWALSAAVVSLAYAALDESLQSFQGQRHASWTDFGIDAAGIFMVLGILYLRSRK